MKKILLSLMFVFLCGLSMNAQSSSTLKGSSNTFKSFTDTYMDVQNSSTIPYPKNFGFISTNSDTISFELGYAHDFGKIKLGLYSECRYLSGSYLEEYAINNDKRVQLVNYLNNAILLGYNKQAIKLGIIGNIFTNSLRKDYITENGKKETYFESLMELDGSFYIQWGGAFELNRLFLKPKLGFIYNLINFETKASDIYSLFITQNNSLYIINAGFDFDIKTKNNFHHETGFDFKLGFGKRKEEQQNSKNNITGENIIPRLSFKYKLTYNVLDEKIKLALYTGLVTQLSKQEGKYTETGTKLNSSYQFALAPYCNFGCLFNIKKDILNIVLGTSFNPPSFIINTEKDTNKNRIAKKISFSLLNANFNAGVNWNINKYVSMDAAINIPIAPELSKTFISYAKIGITFRK